MSKLTPTAAGAPLDLQVGTARGALGQVQFGDDLTGFENRGVRPEIKFAERDFAGAVRAANAHRRVERQQRSGQIFGSIAVGDRAADGAHVAHQGVGDHALGFAEHAGALAQQRRFEHVAVRREGADADAAAIGADIPQVALQPRDVDQRARRGQAQLHHGQ
jgi:hypothetical protein